MQLVSSKNAHDGTGETHGHEDSIIDDRDRNQ
jgi:hypothetical protein